MRRWIKEYRVELAALFIFALGVFLLVEKFEIRRTVRAWLDRIFGIAQKGLAGWQQSLAAYFRSFSLSDLVGWVLVLLALLFILWRVRVRLVKSQRWLGATCPRCGAQLRRTHRTRLDRLVNRLFLPDTRRYRCINPDCRWSGLRQHIHPGHRSAREEDKTAPLEA